jgi:hypothetical protein
MAIGSLIVAFMTGLPSGLAWLIVFVGAACAAVLFEAASELLNVLYQIRDRLPERKSQF